MHYAVEVVHVYVEMHGCVVTLHAGQAGYCFQFCLSVCLSAQ